MVYLGGFKLRLTTLCKQFIQIVISDCPSGCAIEFDLKTACSFVAAMHTRSGDVQVVCASTNHDRRLVLFLCHDRRVVRCLGSTIGIHTCHSRAVSRT